MEGILTFFADVLLVTGGIICLLLWAVLLVLGSVEIYDAVTGADKKKQEKRDA